MAIAVSKLFMLCTLHTVKMLCLFHEKLAALFPLPFQQLFQALREGRGLVGGTDIAAIGVLKTDQNSRFFRPVSLFLRQIKTYDLELNNE